MLFSYSVHSSHQSSSDRINGHGEKAVSPDLPTAARLVPSIGNVMASVDKLLLTLHGVA
jgi:hypothetical protein